MPKKQTKRSLVVNGRQEGFTLPYFNDYATNLINGIKLRQEAVASAQQAYNALKDRQTREFLNNVNTQQSKSHTNIQKQAKALHTAQTDKTFVPAVGRRQNPELNAIPVKEDNTGPLGYAAAIAPFVVASAPFAAVTPTAFANPYVQAGINSYFAAEGVDDIINGRANWSTPINFLPFYGGATKTLANAVGKAYNSGKKAYDTTRLAIGLNNDIRNFAPRYSIKGGNVRTRVGDVENSAPRITRDNAATMTPEQWTAAQDAAIARGDMEEAQRLRDLHFVTKAPNTVIKNVGGMPAHIYHGTPNKGWNSYAKSKFGTATDNGMYGEGLYATSDRSYADVYARGNNADGKYIGEIKDLYVNGEHPFYVFNKKDLSPGEIVNREDAAYQFGRTLKVQNDIPTPIWDEMNNSDIVIETKGTKRPNFAEIVVPKGEQLKLADAVTYDDNRIRIPLGKRDNFKVNDIRYSILPLIGGSILYNNSDKYNHSLGGQLKRRSLKSVKHMF